MKMLFKIILAVLVFLAVSSAVTKIMLMPQEVAFFGEYGFTNPTLIGFGVIQLLAGILLLLPGGRIIGAFVVALTFAVSAVLLALSGNILVTIITLICIALLVFVITQTIKASKADSGATIP